MPEKKGLAALFNSLDLGITEAIYLGTGDIRMISTRENVLISADGNIPRYMCCISSNNPIIEITEVMKQGRKFLK